MNNRDKGLHLLSGKECMCCFFLFVSFFSCTLAIEHAPFVVLYCNTAKLIADSIVDVLTCTDGSLPHKLVRVGEPITSLTLSVQRSRVKTCAFVSIITITEHEYMWRLAPGPSSSSFLIGRPTGLGFTGVYSCFHAAPYEGMLVKNSGKDCGHISILEN